MYGSIRYSGVTVRYVFDTGAGQLFMSQCWKYFCFKPWRRANGYHTITRLHQGFYTLQTKCKIYADEHLNQSFHYKQKVKVKTEWQSFRHLTPLILSETKRDESTSTYADNGIACSCFHSFPLYFSCDPYILKKREEMYFVESRRLK